MVVEDGVGGDVEVDGEVCVAENEHVVGSGGCVDGQVGGEVGEDVLGCVVLDVGVAAGLGLGD